MMNLASRKAQIEKFDEIGVRICFLKFLARLLKNHNKYIKEGKSRRISNVESSNNSI